LRFTTLLLSCLFLWQCATPVASFDFEKTELRVPASIYLENSSQNSEECSWYIDGKEISSEQNLDYTFMESGRHVIELKAYKGNKVVSTSKEIFVKPSLSCLVLVETTAGDLVLELSETTPAHLSNFSALVESGYYHGLIFHRVIQNFMIQGGDNESRSGGKRYEDPQTIPAEIDVSLPHYRGALAAARMPDDMNPTKASSGSQFYIVDGRPLTAAKMKKVQAEKLFDYTDEQLVKYTEVGGAPQLDGEYTVFGYLISGYDVLDRIAQTTTDSYDKPLQDIIITKTSFLN